MKQICLLIFFTANLISAQKVVKKSIVNPEITAINIDANNCFELFLDTADGSEMVLEATIDGEYENDLVLTSKQQGRTIQVSSGFRPTFKNPNDKLSAHKVIAIALKIYVPENKSVTIYGSNCNVTASGAYRKLNITSNDGKCTLNEVSGSIAVMTQSGHILAYTKGGDINAKSKYGIVESDKIPGNQDRYNLTSITGDIRIKKTE